jgi:GNAT superfamily N-acetyltransferase
LSQESRSTEIAIRPFHANDRPACAALLGELPDWFGQPESNASYVADLGVLPSFVAERDGTLVGFTSLRMHTPESAELEVLAVAPGLHRQGVGTRLVSHLENELRAMGGVSLFHVKTLGPSEPHEPYERTRAFYRAKGFVPLLETVALWGPENPALILVKPFA